MHILCDVLNDEQLDPLQSSMDLYKLSFVQTASDIEPGLLVNLSP